MIITIIDLIIDNLILLIINLLFDKYNSYFDLLYYLF